MRNTAKWAAAAFLLVLLILGIGSVFYSFFGVGGVWTFMAGIALVGISAVGLHELGGGGPFNDGSLDDPRARLILAYFVFWFVAVAAGGGSPPAWAVVVFLTQWVWYAAWYAQHLRTRWREDGSS